MPDAEGGLIILDFGFWILDFEMDSFGFRGASPEIRVKSIREPLISTYYLQPETRNLIV